VGARVGLDSNRVTGVLSILKRETDFCYQFSKKERFVVMSFLDFFFFLKCRSGKIELLVRALGF
jgi:hypothetical protein